MRGLSTWIACIPYALGELALLSLGIVGVRGVLNNIVLTTLHK